MTIRVTVKNEDQGAGRVISVNETLADGMPIAGCLAKKLRGGESVEVFVHGSNQFVVQEVECEATPATVPSKS